MPFKPIKSRGRMMVAAIRANKTIKVRGQTYKLVAKPKYKKKYSTNKFKGFRYNKPITAYARR